MSIPNPAPKNLVGALIFTSYVAAALSLTAFISWDLGVTYRSISPSHRSSIRTRLRTCFSFSLLSFGVLSWHMLAFLVVSYNKWAENGGDGFLGQRFGARLWEWLTTATLFEDFAKGLCGSWARYWWTAEALVLTLEVGRWMAKEGRRHQVPHQWAYFAIGQILPISFAQNLFAIAVLLSPSPSHPDLKSSPSSHPSSKTKSPRRFSRCISAPHTILNALFYAILFAIPLSIDTPVFIPIILTVRLLLFAPLYLPSANTSALAVIVPFLASCSNFVTENRAQGIKADPVWWYGVSAAAINTVASAVNDNHAVQALGWDAVISVGSGLIWYLGA